MPEADGQCSAVPELYEGIWQLLRKRKGCLHWWHSEICFADMHCFVWCHKKDQSLTLRIYVCNQSQHVPLSCALWPFEKRSKLESFPQLIFQGRKLSLDKHLAVRKVCIKMFVLL